MVERDPEVDVIREKGPDKPGQVLGRAPTPIRSRGESQQLLQLAEPVAWGPIWGGLMVAVITIVILGSFVTAIGLSAYGGAGGPPAGAGTWFITLVIAIVAAFLGGLVAGSRLPAEAGRASGLMQGIYLSGLILGFALLAGLLGTAAGSLMLASLRVTTTVVAPANAAASAAYAAGWLTVISCLVVIAAAAGGAIAGNRQRHHAGTSATT